MIELTSSFDWVNVLGWLELGVVFVALSAALQDRLKEEEDQKEDKSVFERIGLVVSVLAIFFDVILSSIDFFRFTVNTHTAFSELSSSISEQESFYISEYEGESGTEQQTKSNSNMPKCLIVGDLYPSYPAIPVPVVSSINCMELPVVVDFGSKSWAIW